jgi:hypothetical protein
MKRKLTYSSTAVALGILVLTLGTAYQERMIGDTKSLAVRACPYHVPLGPQYQMEIVRMRFTVRVENPLYARQIPDIAMQEYRFAVVTLKIIKPAGQSLSLAAADLSLHYYHGEDTEVAPCEGLSWFKNEAESDAPLLLSPLSGPGFIKQTTGPVATAGTTVYIDAVFAFVEPDTKKCWICVGHPATTEPFVCPSPAWESKSVTPEVPPSASVSAA